MTDTQQRIVLSVGTCALCGQEMLRTATDCWHPWDVAEACPPGDPTALPAGTSSGRPGREHFIPAP